MRGVLRRVLMAALAAGMVVTMTGCGAAVPTGDALYRDGEKRYTDYSTVMHDVIMAIHEGEWTVESYGASPIACRADGDLAGYAFSWVRTLEPEQLDVDAVVADASSAFEEAGMAPETSVLGDGERREINVIATGGAVGRGVVIVRPGRGIIEVSAAPGCFPGDAGDLSDMVFDGLVYTGASQRFPAFEGPVWQPRFYFPEGGSPIYRDEDGAPVQPQPDVTEFPVAPYGD
ncbi:hypothetical protein [Microbacterium abyssi]|uniref:hypothetical protein n=1 Tax=Microbacterium abyssi TaxID=2782166 RepID=UPI001888E17D|nr:hypothetical protein [Microbacterium sp. A18JL241]